MSGSGTPIAFDFFWMLCIVLSRVVEQRLSLAVGLRSGDTTEESVAARILGCRNVKRNDQENGEDDKGKDPLQSDYFDGDLLDSQS